MLHVHSEDGNQLLCEVEVLSRQTVDLRNAIQLLLEEKIVAFQLSSEGLLTLINPSFSAIEAVSETKKKRVILSIGNRVFDSRVQKGESESES